MDPRAAEKVRILLLIALGTAFWPVWRWMGARLIDGSDAHWELFAALTAIAVLWRDRNIARNLSLGWLPIVLVMAYAASYPATSPLVRATIAFAAIGSACSSLWYARPVEAPLCGLLMLSLPLMASLEFYAGYPLRVIVGDATAWLLQTTGIAVAREGTLLTWSGHSVAIDAPCSGIRMLWTGSYLSFALAALFRLDALRTMAIAAVAVLVVIAANIMRATSLFYIEAGIVAAPAIAHEGIGVLMFVFAAVTLGVLSQRLARVAHAD